MFSFSLHSFCFSCSFHPCSLLHSFSRILFGPRLSFESPDLNRPLPLPPNNLFSTFLKSFSYIIIPFNCFFLPFLFWHWWFLFDFLFKFTAMTILYMFLYPRKIKFYSCIKSWTIEQSTFIIVCTRRDNADLMGKVATQKYLSWKDTCKVSQLFSIDKLSCIHWASWVAHTWILASYNVIQTIYPLVKMREFTR